LVVALFASSDFPAENPRTQTRNVPYTNTLAVSVTELTAEIIQLKNLLFDNF